MRRLCAVLVSLVLTAGGCGREPADTSGAPSTPADATFPVTIQAADGTVQIPARPERVISLSPTATELLFAVGAGDQVVAVDDQSDYPPGVPTTELSGYEPNIEAIAGYEPDLVVSDGSAIKSLKSLGIPVLVQPAAGTLDDTYAQIEEIGVATGHQSEAADLVDDIRSRIAAIVESAPRFAEPLTYYHELDDTYFTVTSKTFIGEIYNLVGLRNIADKADKAGTGYPQLSAEYIIEADPDFIFLADSQCCNQTPERVAKRPGWNQITAVETGAVISVGDDIASRWGPRIVDFLEIVATAVAEFEPAA